jgi:hypothetical protein
MISHGLAGDKSISLPVSMTSTRLRDRFRRLRIYPNRLVHREIHDCADDEERPGWYSCRLTRTAMPWCEGWDGAKMSVVYSSSRES